MTRPVASTAPADVPPDWGTVLPAADVNAGGQQSTKCLSCHSFAKGGPNGTGPDNWGVVGRHPAGHPGFTYSSAMTDYGTKHPAWNYDELYEFLKNPQGYISGTKMTFVGIKAPADRINLIAWLRQQSDAPAPIPAAKPAAASTASAATPATPGGTGTTSGATTPKAPTDNKTSIDKSSGGAAQPVEKKPAG